MDFHSLKRKQLQDLCKKHGIPANLKNLEMANRLSSLLINEEKPENVGLDGKVVVDSNEEKKEKELEKAERREKPCLKGMSDVVDGKEVKKVRFSPENQTFLFEKTDPRAMRLLSRKKRAFVELRGEENPVVVFGNSVESQSLDVVSDDVGRVGRRNVRRKSVVVSDGGGLVGESDEKGEKLGVKGGELERNLRSRRGKARQESIEVMSLVSLSGVDEVEHVVEGRNLRRKSRTTMVVQAEDLGLVTENVDEVEKLPAQRGIKDQNLRSQRGKAKPKSTEVVSLMSPCCVNKVEDVVKGPNLRRSLRRSMFVCAEDIGLVTENADDVEKLPVKRGIKDQNLRSREAESKQENTEVVSLMSLCGVSKMEDVVKGPNLRRNLRRSMFVREEDIGLVTENADDVEKLPVKRGMKDQNLRSREGKAKPENTEVVLLVSPCAVTKVEDVVKGPNLRRNLRRSMFVRAEDLGLVTENADKVEKLPAKRGIVDQNLRSRAGKANQETLQVVSLLPPSGNENLEKPVEGNLNRSLRSRGGKSKENGAEVELALSIHENTTEKGRKGKGAVEEGADGVDRPSDEMVLDVGNDARVTRTKENGAEVVLALSIHENTTKKGRKGKRTVEEGADEGVDGPSDEMVLDGGSDARVTRRQLRTREVAYEDLGVSDIINCKNPKKRSRPRKSVRVVEKVEPIRNTSISKGEMYNECPTEDFVESQSQHSLEMILENKSKNRSWRKTLILKRQDINEDITEKPDAARADHLSAGSSADNIVSESTHPEDEQYQATEEPNSMEQLVRKFDECTSQACPSSSQQPYMAGDSLKLDVCIEVKEVTVTAPENIEVNVQTPGNVDSPPTSLLQNSADSGAKEVQECLEQVARADNHPEEENALAPPSPVKGTPNSASLCSMSARICEDASVGMMTENSDTVHADEEQHTISLSKLQGDSRASEMFESKQVLEMYHHGRIEQLSIEENRPEDSSSLSKKNENVLGSRCSAKKPDIAGTDYISIEDKRAGDSIQVGGLLERRKPELEAIDSFPVEQKAECFSGSLPLSSSGSQQLRDTYNTTPILDFGEENSSVKKVVKSAEPIVQILASDNTSTTLSQSTGGGGGNKVQDTPFELLAIADYTSGEENTTPLSVSKDSPSLRSMEAQYDNSTSEQLEQANCNEIESSLHHLFSEDGIFNTVESKVLESKMDDSIEDLQDKSSSQAGETMVDASLSEQVADNNEHQIVDSTEACSLPVSQEPEVAEPCHATGCSNQVADDNERQNMDNTDTNNELMAVPLVNEGSEAKEYTMEMGSNKYTNTDESEGTKSEKDDYVEDLQDTMYIRQVAETKLDALPGGKVADDNECKNMDNTYANIELMAVPLVSEGSEAKECTMEMGSSKYTNEFPLGGSTTECSPSDRKEKVVDEQDHAIGDSVEFELKEDIFEEATQQSPKGSLLFSLAHDLTQSETITEAKGTLKNSSCRPEVRYQTCAKIDSSLPFVMENSDNGEEVQGITSEMPAVGDNNTQEDNVFTPQVSVRGTDNKTFFSSIFDQNRLDASEAVDCSSASHTMGENCETLNVDKDELFSSLSKADGRIIEGENFLSSDSVVKVSDCENDMVDTMLDSSALIDDRLTVQEEIERSKRECDSIIDGSSCGKQLNEFFSMESEVMACEGSDEGKVQSPTTAKKTENMEAVTLLQDRDCRSKVHISESSLSVKTSVVEASEAVGCSSISHTIGANCEVLNVDKDELFSSLSKADGRILEGENFLSSDSVVKASDCENDMGDKMLDSSALIDDRLTVQEEIERSMRGCDSILDGSSCGKQLNDFFSMESVVMACEGSDEGKVQSPTTAKKTENMEAVTPLQDRDCRSKVHISESSLSVKTSVVEASEPVGCSSISHTIGANCEVLIAGKEQLSSSVCELEGKMIENETFDNNEGPVKAPNSVNEMDDTVLDYAALIDNKLTVQLTDQEEVPRSMRECDIISSESGCIKQLNEFFSIEKVVVANDGAIEGRDMSPSAVEELENMEAIMLSQGEEAGCRSTKPVSESDPTVKTYFFCKPNVGELTPVLGSMEKGEDINIERSNGDHACSNNSSRVDNLALVDRQPTFKLAEEAHNSIELNAQRILSEDHLINVDGEKGLESEKALTVTEHNVAALGQDKGLSVSSQDNKLSELEFHFSANDCSADLNSLFTEMGEMSQAAECIPCMPQEETDDVFDILFDNYMPQACDNLKHDQDDKGELVEMHHQVSSEALLHHMKDSIAGQNQAEFTCVEGVLGRVASVAENVVLGMGESHSSGRIETNAGEIKEISGGQDFKEGNVMHHEIAVPVDDTGNKRCTEADCDITDSRITQQNGNENQVNDRAHTVQNDACNITNHQLASEQTEDIENLPHGTSVPSDDCAYICDEKSLNPEPIKQYISDQGSSQLWQQIINEECSDNHMALAPEDVATTGHDQVLEGADNLPTSPCDEIGIDSAPQHISHGECTSSLATVDSEEMGYCTGTNVRSDVDEEKDSMSTQNVKAVDETDDVDDKLMLKDHNRIILIHGTPRKHVLPKHDMKENMLAPKRSQIANATASKPMRNRKPLGDI